jgi:hypothetical protein
MECKFQVGQKIVCVVDQDEWKPDPGCVVGRIELPVRGVVYTVRAVRVIGTCLPCVLLREIENAPRDTEFGVLEVAYDAQGFRPVRETSIEVFEKILARENARHEKERVLELLPPRR